MEKKGLVQRAIPWASIGAAIGASIIGSTIAAFADEMIDWFRDKSMKSKGKEYFIEMLKAHPSLKKEDPKVVAQYWASLFHFAPHMAADPLSSGAFIRQSIARGFPEQFGGPPIDTYSALTGINKSIADLKNQPSRFSDATSSAAGAILGTSYEHFARFPKEEKKSYRKRKY